MLKNCLDIFYNYFLPSMFFIVFPSQVSPCSVKLMKKFKNSVSPENFVEQLH